MKGRHLAILLALLLIVGGAGYYLQKGNQSSWSSSGGGAGGKVLDFPINDVVTARLKSKDAELNLTKKGDEWTVAERAGYPANFEQVGTLLRKLWELKTVQEVKVGASQLPRLELIEPGKGENSGTLIEFKDKDGKNLSALLLGKKHLRKGDSGPMGGEGFPTGRYVMAVGGNKVSLVSDTLDDADPKPERWLRKDFIKIESPVVISMNGQAETMRWKLTRDSATADWKLADAKPEETLDTGKVSSFATILTNPNFKDVLAPDAKPEETGLDKPATVTFETSDAFTYTLQIGKVTNDAYPVLISGVTATPAKERTPGAEEKPEDKTRLDTEFQAKQKRLEEKLAKEKKFEGRAFLLEKFTIEPLLKDRAALLAEKKPDPAASSAPASSALATPTPGAPPVSVTTPPVSVPPAPPTPPAPSTPSTPTTPVPGPPSSSPPTPAPNTPATEPATPGSVPPPAPPTPATPPPTQEGPPATPPATPPPAPEAPAPPPVPEPKPNPEPAAAPVNPAPASPSEAPPASPTGNDAAKL